MISGKRKTIGVFLCKAYAVFDSIVFHMMEEKARELDYDIIFFSTVGYFASENEFDTQEKKMFSFAPLEKLDGILVAPDTYEIPGFRDALLNEIRSRAVCPVVTIRHFSHEFDCSFTEENNTIRPLIRHLLDDHHLTRIGFLAGYEGHPDSEMRLETFREEMAARNLPIDEGHDIFHGNMWYSCGQDAYRHYFLEQETPPQAIVCANDFMAVGLMRVLQGQHIRVPEDVIVTGYDNVPDITLECPTLTTVEQDFQTIVQRGIDELDRQIRAGGVRDRRQVRQMPVPGRLVLGESCGCGRRPVDQFLTISKERSIALETINSREVNMTYFTIETSAAESIQELHDALVKKQADTPMIRDFYLCIFEEERNTAGERIFAEQMTDTACLVHLRRDGQDHGMPMISFPRTDLLPRMAEREEEPQVFYLTLLHQREFNYGYAMFHYTQGQIPTAFFQHWNVTLSGALRNIHNMEELHRLYEERRQSSITDMLTKLYNRRGLMEKVEPDWDRLCAEQENVAFISFDLDCLKEINDTWGHQAGDYAIRLLAEAIRRSMPRSAVCARLGGDEFLAFIPRISDSATLETVRRFDDTLNELNRKEDCSFQVEASRGAFTARLNAGTTLEECIHGSDQALYMNKEAHHEMRRRRRNDPG